MAHPDRSSLETSDIVRSAREGFIERSRRWITWRHHKILLAITRCRTAALGGHRYRCSACGHTAAISYNSCRNQALPTMPNERARALAPSTRTGATGHRDVHLVLTLPCELAPFALQNKRLIYNPAVPDKCRDP
jgi:hypothetical protein